MTTFTLFQKGQNKVVHDESQHQEGRSCIIRTILLLHDLIAIKNKLFEVYIKMDYMLKRLFKNSDSSRPIIVLPMVGLNVGTVSLTLLFKISIAAYNP